MWHLGARTLSSGEMLPSSPAGVHSAATAQAPREQGLTPPRANAWSLLGPWAGTGPPRPGLSAHGLLLSTSSPCLSS